MANGRLARCTISGRQGVALYCNTSSSAASVTIQTNAISTTANSELTVVVGIASTTLGLTETLVTGSAGSYCSMTSPLYACDTCTGVSTFMGAWINPADSDWTEDATNECWVRNLGITPNNRLLNYVGADGTRTLAQNSAWTCQIVCCPGSSECWMVPQTYGGSSIHNPSIYMREFPTVCNCDGYFWGAKVLGMWPQVCCSCTWTHGMDYHSGQRDASWMVINGAHVGWGVSSRAADNANRIMANWCCCCGIGAAGVAPFNRCSGCSSGQVVGGNPCNYQFCECRGSFGGYCCMGGGGHKSWNFYALRNDVWCCCCAAGATSSGSTCMCRTKFSPQETYGACPRCLEAGKMRSPAMIMFRMCCNSGSGDIFQMGVTTCLGTANNGCGCMCYYCTCCKCLNSSATYSSIWCQNMSCWCHPCLSGWMNGPCSNGWMSPYGWSFGMTQCMIGIWTGFNATGSTLPGCDAHHRYFITSSDVHYMGVCCYGYSNCYFYQSMYSRINEAPSARNEFPIKYMEYNPHVTSCDGTTEGCIYFLIRSNNTKQCGIFSVDAQAWRQQQGPFCGCTGNADFCCNQICMICECFSPGYNDHWVKVADWPTTMVDAAYETDPRNQGEKMYCFSCLFRTDYCSWNINIWNKCNGNWDAFQSTDLIKWEKIGNPWSKTVSETLTQTVTSDYACITQTCNCFMSNIDCSGLIDYKISANQYERTGVVLSSDDILMINNNSDTIINAQVWGYEG